MRSNLRTQHREYSLAKLHTTVPVARNASILLLFRSMSAMRMASPSLVSTPSIVNLRTEGCLCRAGSMAVRGRCRTTRVFQTASMIATSRGHLQRHLDRNHSRNRSRTHGWSASPSMIEGKSCELRTKSFVSRDVRLPATFATK
jgi:hypothetical protein